MKANGRFYGFSAIFNFVLGVIGFLILWGVRVLTKEAILGFVICGIIFLALAVYVNLFVVKRAKLKTVYFIFGTVVNLLVCAAFTTLTILI